MSFLNKITTDAAETTRQVAFVVKLNKRMHGYMDTAARSCMFQMLVHRNSTPMLDLLNGLSGTSIHVVGLKNWVEKFGNVKVALVDKKIKIVYLSKDNLEADVAMPAIVQMPSFWVYSPPRALRVSTMTLSLQPYNARRPSIGMP